MRYGNVLGRIFGKPWAITPEALALVTDVVRFRIEHGPLSADEIRERIEGAERRRGPVQKAGRVGVIPIVGVIDQRMDLLTDVSGGASTDSIGSALDEMVADESIRTIVLDVHSPGGSVYGVDELASKVYAARDSKRIVAVSNSEMASAAYWIGSQAHEVVASPNSLTGSIGIIAQHVDESARDEREGVRVEYLTAGKYKGEGHQHGPLADEARDHMRGQLNEYYGRFVGSVARGRGVSKAAVRDGFGEGRVLTSDQAKAAGLVDRIDSFEAVLRRELGRYGRRSNATRAARRMAALGFGVDLGDG